MIFISSYLDINSSLIFFSVFFFSISSTFLPNLLLEFFLLSYVNFKEHFLIRFFFFIYTFLFSFHADDILSFARTQTSRFLKSVSFKLPFSACPHCLVKVFPLV